MTVHVMHRVQESLGADLVVSSLRCQIAADFGYSVGL